MKSSRQKQESAKPMATASFPIDGACFCTCAYRGRGQSGARSLVRLRGSGIREEVRSLAAAETGRVVRRHEARRLLDRRLRGGDLALAGVIAVEVGEDAALRRRGDRVGLQIAVAAVGV